MPRLVAMYDPSKISHDAAVNRASQSGVDEVCAGIPQAYTGVISQGMLDANQGWYVYADISTPTDVTPPEPTFVIPVSAFEDLHNTLVTMVTDAGGSVSALSSEQQSNCVKAILTYMIQLGVNE